VYAILFRLIVRYMLFGLLLFNNICTRICMTYCNNLLFEEPLELSIPIATIDDFI